MSGLDAAKVLAGAEIASTERCLTGMAATTDPDPVGAAAQAAMVAQLGSPPACMVVNPLPDRRGPGPWVSKVFVGTESPRALG
jgi:hypothetical protein